MSARFLTSMLLALVLSACGQAPELPSPGRMQSVESNRRAQAAFEAGDYARAEAEYRRALRADQAIEDMEGVAVNLLSLALLTPVQS